VESPRREKEATEIRVGRNGKYTSKHDEVKDEGKDARKRIDREGREQEKKRHGDDQRNKEQ